MAVLNKTTLGLDPNQNMPHNKKPDGRLATTARLQVP